MHTRLEDVWYASPVWMRLVCVRVRVPRVAGAAAGSPRAASAGGRGGCRREFGGRQGVHEPCLADRRARHAARRPISCW